MAALDEIIKIQNIDINKNNIIIPLKSFFLNFEKPYNKNGILISVKKHY